MNTGQGLLTQASKKDYAIMGNWTVYRHISPSGKVYVGITSRATKKRWAYGYGYKNSTMFKSAILKYGWNNIKHEVLFTGLTEERAKKLEIDLIRHYKNLGISYNITDGGDGHLGCSWCPSIELRKKWSEQRKGRKLTKEWKDKISKATKGKVFRRDIIEKAAKASGKARAKAIVQYSLDGTVVKEWSSIREAARAFNVFPADLLKCCQGKRKTRVGFMWKYKEEN